MKTAFLFPGQGAQHVGMGKDLYEAFAAARRVFDLAAEASGLPLRELCFDGPETELARTDVCQPAIFTVSAAVLACMDGLLDPPQVLAMRPDYMAGLSLGEYTALYAADMIDFADVLRLVARRGAAMQAAATAVPSGMLAVVGLDEAKAGELCRSAAEGQVLACANFNCPGQVVLSGQIEACRRAEAQAPGFGASAAKMLDVAGAFHSRIMAPAAEQLCEALDAAGFRAPRGRPPSGDRAALAEPEMGQEFASDRTEVISNVEAMPYGCPCRAKQLLVAQLTSPVRWQQSMEYMLAQGVERFYEVGPGRVLAGLMRRINRKAEVICLNSVKAVENLLAGE